jgi:hypothetical protein
MAQTIEEFLVSVKYNIDAPSQQKFFETLKRISTSVGGIAGEITALGVAILKLSETLAAAGEKLYWVSQRVGDSVTQIQDAAFAMSNLGMSAGEATEGIEKFAAWTRNMGPAATGYLRALGVNARDTIGQMRELGQHFRSMGGTLDFAHGTDAQRLQYSIALRQAALMNIDERTMLALSSGRMEEGERQAGMMQRIIWGKNWQTGPQDFAKQSQAVMTQFRQMGFIFQALEQWFSAGLFTKILPDLKDINALLIRIMPDIQRFLERMIAYAPAVLHFLEGAIKGLDLLIKFSITAIDMFDKLPAALQHALELFMAMPVALRLMSSPLAWILAGVFMLIGALDDYKHWQDDQKHPNEPHTAQFDWSKPDAMFKGIEDHLQPFKDVYDYVLKISKEFNDWAVCLGMNRTLLEGIEATLALILAKYLLGKGLGAVGGWIAGIPKWLGFGGGEAAGGAAAGGAAGAEAGAVAGVAARIGAQIGSYLKAGLGIGLAVVITTWLQEERNKASASMVDWITGRKPGETAKRNAEMNAAGEKQFTDFLHGVNDWMENAVRRGLGRTLFGAPPGDVQGGPREAEEMLGLPGPAAPLPIPPRPPVEGPSVAKQIGDAAASIGAWFSSLGQRGLGRALGGTPPGEQPMHSMQRMPDGSYKLASAGNDWMVPHGFSGPVEADDSDDRLFNLLRINFDALIEKLRDILDTLTALALKAGVDPSTLPGGGIGGGSMAPGGGGGEGGDVGPLLPPGASLEEQEAKLKQIEHRESGGQNIVNRQGPGGTPASTASGYYQMIDDTWKWAARRAGIDVSLYPRAINATWELQHKAALALINAQGERPWLASAPHLSHPPLGATPAPNLSHLPLGADGGAGSTQPGAPTWAGKPPSRQEIHNETHINVTAPNPASAAHQVAEAQPRVFEHHIRYAKGALLA